MVARRINPGAILQSPLLIVTLAIAFVAWFIAFIGMCVGEARFHHVSGAAPLYGVEWFAIWVQILVTMFFLIACAHDSLGSHRFQLSIFLAICIVFAVQGVQKIYSRGYGSSTAAGVGWLLICIVDLIWLLFLSTEDDTWLYALYTNAGHPGWSGSRRASGRVSRAEAGYGSEASGLRMNGADRGMVSHDIPTTGYGGMTGGYANSGYAAGGSPVGTPMSKVTSNPRNDGFGDSRPTSARTADTMVYTKMAKANYAYSASPDDPNEVSFAKGDILQVVDATGKWYQVKTPNGETGIAPSNYLTILE